jgi:Tol biopolymer transport system component
LEQFLNGIGSAYGPVTMVKRFISRLLITVLILMSFNTAEGQFYNGLQMSFGKNRVHYYDYYWSFYRFEDIDCYFNENGRDLAQFTADYALKRLSEIEDYFDYKLEKRLIFVIYNKQAEYKQSNIGLVTFSDDDYNLGGYSRLIKNKVMLYYEGDHVAFERQISQSISEAIINEMIANADVRDRTSSTSSINMPDWYLKGLINYTAFGWDYTAENKVKDGFKTGSYRKITHLEYDDAIYAGQSFWRFIGKQYGDALIPNIIYLTKIYKNIDDGFLFVLGQKLSALFLEWQKYYKDEFAGDKDNTSESGNVVKKGARDQIVQQVKVSPDNKYIAFVTNDWGKKKIWLYDQATGKSKIIFRKEPKYEQKTDNTYPVITWHPNSRILTYINEERADLEMYFYRLNEKKTEKRLLLYFDKVLDFSYAPEGSRLVFSAVKDGTTDIYIHTISSGTNEQITRDVADDLNPVFLKDSPDEILFSSNRASDSLKNDANPYERLSPTFDLFTYNIATKPAFITRLTEGRFDDRFRSSGAKKKIITYLGNNNGVFNRYFARLDSSISYVDTTTHYRYFINSRPITNYDRNILEQDVLDGSDTYGEVIFDKGRYYVKRGKVAGSNQYTDKDLVQTSFRKEQVRLLHKADSIEKLRQWLVAEDKKRRDTLKKPLYEYYVKDEPIDINHYIFEKEKQNYYEQLWRKDYMNIDLDTGELQLPQIRIYQPSFYNNYIATQIDFSFLSNSYQAYNGGAPYFNPGVNLFTKIGVLDLFENYKVTGGFRFAGNFDSNEYLLSVENLKGKFDKQFIYHRQTFKSSDDTSLYKIHSDNFYLSFARPITPVLALKGTISYRYDKYVTMSTDVATLSKPDIDRHWVSLKGEVIYDNTRKKMINIYYGTRFKIFGEYYKELTATKSDMIVVGVDFRHYFRIHRELIWANRIAASTSYGPTKLIYYLGGVDNWMGYLFNKGPMFNASIPVDPNQRYGFQAIATNMRGFSQNIRNGSSFALLNSEIRWPIIRYFVGHPLRSNLLNSIQIVGFGDVGTAWSGRSPWSGQNAYDTEVIKNGPIVVTLDTNREPFVAGFGGGFRLQLMGYFIRADWARGIENHYLLPRVFYLSFSLDF